VIGVFNFRWGAGPSAAQLLAPHGAKRRAARPGPDAGFGTNCQRHPGL